MATSSGTVITPNISLEGTDRSTGMIAKAVIPMFMQSTTSQTRKIKTSPSFVSIVNVKLTIQTSVQC